MDQYTLLRRRLDTKNRLHFTRTGGIRLKTYLDEMKGRPVQAFWDDIGALNSQAQERLGYPTQKPEALLERIINASSNKGDVVLDPFCGCGIDVTHIAITLIRHRLRDSFGEELRPRRPSAKRPAAYASKVGRGR